MWSTALLLVLTPLYVGFLGVESYGLIGFYTSLIAILGILDTGISATAVREIAWLAARPSEEAKIPILLRSLEIAYWGIVLTLGLFILGAAWFWGAGWFQARDLPPAMVREALLLMAISLVVQVPAGLYNGGLIGLQRHVQFSFLAAFFGTVRGAGAILVLWMIAPDIRFFFGWQIVVSALQTWVIRTELWRKVSRGGGPPRFSRSVLQSVKGFAGWMTLITALGVIMTQADKMILSRVVSLEVFGFYMLAWTVASGLSRVSTPLMQTFGPHFTELVSKGDEVVLAGQVRIASQLMNTLILPPVAVLFFFAEPVLAVWTGNSVLAAGSGPILAIVVVGTAFSSCSYPALSILYSRKLLRPVIVVNLLALVVLLPLLFVAVAYFGVRGAAFCWMLYGLLLYVVYQVVGLRGLPGTGFLQSVLQDFVLPCLVSFTIAGVTHFWLSEVKGRAVFIALLGLCLIAGWVVSLMVCRDLLKNVLEKMKWHSRKSR